MKCIVLVLILRSDSLKVSTSVGTDMPRINGHAATLSIIYAVAFVYFQTIIPKSRRLSETEKNFI